MKIFHYWWRQPQLAQLIRAYQKMSSREQWLVRLTLSVLLVLLLLSLLAMPLWQQSQQLWQQQAEMTTDNQRLQSVLQALRDNQLHDPNQALRDELTHLNAQQTILDERINALTRSLVSPAQMTSLLAAMLMQDKQLQPTSLQTLPAQRVELGEGFDDVQLYRHSLRLTMTATYPALVTYLQKLDGVPWLIGWEMLTFDISHYPRGDVTLEVSTLSRQQEVLGGS